MLAAEGMSQKTIRGELYALRVFFDFLNLGGLVKRVPPRMLNLRPRHIPKVLTQEELRRVLAAARTKHERALPEVFYGTGFRTRELCSMRVEDIAFDERRIRVRGKGGARFIMFTRTVAKALRAYLGDRRTGYAFVDQKPPQRIRPQRGRYGQWQCHWKIYDDAGNHVLTKSGFNGGRPQCNYRQAVFYFSELAKDDSLRRPVGCTLFGQLC